MDFNSDPGYNDFYNSGMSPAELISQMSHLIGTGLTTEQLEIVVELINFGANPEELAKLIQNLRRESNHRQNAINRLFRSQSRPDLS